MARVFGPLVKTNGNKSIVGIIHIPIAIHLHEEIEVPYQMLVPSQYNTPNGNTTTLEKVLKNTVLWLLDGKEPIVQAHVIIGQVIRADQFIQFLVRQDTDDGAFIHHRSFPTRFAFAQSVFGHGHFTGCTPTIRNDEIGGNLPGPVHLQAFF
jgi:hypothetical protein